MTDADNNHDTVKQTEASLQQKVDELTALNRIMRAITVRLDPSVVIDTAFTEIMHILKPDLVTLFLAEGDTLVLRASRIEPGVTRHPELPPHKVGECLCGLAVSSGKAIYSGDIRNESRCTWHECKQMGMRSAATLPLLEGGTVFGVLLIASMTFRDFARESAFLETLTGQFAACLNITVLHQQLQTQLATQISLTTARDHLQDELAKNEERFRLAMEATSDGLWDWNVATDESYFSPAYYRMLGYDPNEFPMTGEAWRAHIHPEDRQRAMKANLDCVEGRTSSFGVEFRMKTKDGGWKWILGRGKTAQKNTDGRALRMVGTHVDITARKNAEVALQESEQRFRFAVQHAPAIFFILDRNGVFLLSEGQALSRLSLAPGQVVGASAFDLYRDNPSISASIRMALAGETTRILNDIDGAIFDTIYAPYTNAAGERIGVIGVAVDITERKKLEQQLLRAQKMEAVGTLAGGVAHDFNNLLTGMLGYTSLMLHDTHDEHHHYRKLKSIESQIRSASELTKQLLGFARGGKYEVKPTDLNELVKSSSEMFGRTRKELSISCRLQPDLRPAEVDRVQIEQVLMNLYVNAWQAMQRGGSLFLSTENVVLDEPFCRPFGVKQGAYLKISVMDTGAGMDEKTQGRIFEPFFTTKEKGVGTGLGLASAYGIVRNHGGIINVYSEVGKGSTFTVYLPASLKEVEKGKQIPKGLVAGVGTILLVDDQEIVSEVGAEMLSTLGYDVIVAGTGEDAVRIYAGMSERILLVILDMIMPGMSGSEIFDRLKQINPDVKVILSSGYSMDGQASEILNRGCRGFIQKPFNLQDLSRKIELALQQ